MKISWSIQVMMMMMMISKWRTKSTMTGGSSSKEVVVWLKPKTTICMGVPR